MSTQSPLSQFAALAVALSAGLLATPVLAQIRPAYVKNIDEPGRTPFVASVVYATLGCVSSCSGFITTGADQFLLFDGPPVPAGKRFIVESVSGTVPARTTSTSVSVLAAATTDLSVPLVWHFGGPFYPFTFLGVTPQQSFTSPAYFTLGPGEVPHLRVLSDGAISRQVSNIVLSGYLIDAAN